MEQWGASRSSVREALRILEGMGLLEVRPGLGACGAAVVSGTRATTLWTTWLLDREHIVRDLLEARETLELRAALLAAARIGDDKLQDLEWIPEEEGSIHYVETGATGPAPSVTAGGSFQRWIDAEGMQRWRTG